MKYIENVDEMGVVIEYEVIGKGSVDEMLSPVVCKYCGKIYDLGNVKVIARHADCSVFETPCCHQQADDRLWKSFPDFRKIKIA